MPTPKDPEKLAAYREKMRQIALERGNGKWMRWRPARPGFIEHLRSRKGKTYEEVYGVERAEKERESRKIGNKIAKAGKRPAHLLKLQEEIAQKRKGKTYAEIYGEAAEEETKKRQTSNRKRWEGKPKKADQRPKHNGDHHYSDWRKAVFERDDFTCQRCHQRGGTLQAHRIHSWSKFPALRYDIENGVTLCVACHKIANEEQRIAEKEIVSTKLDVSPEQEATG